MNQEQKGPSLVATSYGVGLSLTAAFFGAVGLVSGEFWFPSRAKRAVSGPLGRILGGLFLVAGTVGLVLTIIQALGRETDAPAGRSAGPGLIPRRPPSLRSQADERAAAEYLGLESDEPQDGERGV